MSNFENILSEIFVPSLDAIIADRNLRMLHEALYVGAYQGIPVFPVNPTTEEKKAKKPFTDHGFKDATTDPEVIKSYWGNRYKGAMLGVPTGQTSGIVVVDLDIKADKNGIESLKILEESIGEKLPLTRTIQTQSGGLHLYFKAPDDVYIKSTVSKIGLGIDIRADGGYVAYEGSINEKGAEYFVIEEVPLADIPGWFLELLLKSQRAKNALFINGKIQDGARNTNISKLLGSCRSFGMEEESLIRTGIFINGNFCNPPLDESEVVAVAQSIGKYPRSYTFDNMGNADRLADKYSKIVKCVGGKDWYVWNNGVFEPDVTKKANEMAKQVAKDLDAESKNLPDAGTDEQSDIQKSLNKAAKAARNNPLAILPLAASDPRIAIDPKQFDQYPHFLNCRNCIVELNTGEKLEHDPQYLLTRQCNANYDPEAKADLWLEFLNYITEGDQELIGFLARLYGGVGLHGSNPAHVMAIIFGYGRNGKSIFAETIRHVMGSYSDVMRQDVLMAKTTQNLSHDIADLRGARFLLASEPPPGAKLNASVIKHLTGGDTVKARHIYQNSISFPCEGLITLVTNWEPEIEAGDFALKERLLLIKLNRLVPKNERDPLLGDKLKKEEDGIMSWLIQGRMDYTKRGLCVPQKIIQETAAYNTDMDCFEQFLASECTMDLSLKEQASKLWNAYFVYINLHSEGKNILGQKRFFNLLERKFSKTEINGLKYYVGIGLKKK